MFFFVYAQYCLYTVSGNLLCIRYFLGREGYLLYFSCFKSSENGSFNLRRSGKRCKGGSLHKNLGEVFLHGNEAVVDGDFAKKAKIRFDASERCEGVLQQILNEVLQKADQVGKTANHTKREECEMVTEPPLEGLGGKKSTEHDKGVSVDSVEILEFDVKSKAPKKSMQPNANGEPSGVAKNSVEHDGQFDTSIDSERAEDEN
ncbi:hypothetical protein OSB04_031200 [Centaurea solstitialis]|uniref:Uncharacterized protein n=1 Tax=Centaurea solstitialis TaxID=347529 RepID=A0AA38SSK2_9ASTR|nr:hypothetical protein OSB04_031200 [Centaurea solstitialis]